MRVKMYLTKMYLTKHLNVVLYLLNTPTRPPPFQGFLNSGLEGKNDLLRPCVVGISMFTLKIFVQSLKIQCRPDLSS